MLVCRLCYAMLCYAVVDNGRALLACLCCEGRTADKYGVEQRRKPGSAREGGQNGQFCLPCRTLCMCVRVLEWSSRRPQARQAGTAKT